ncbi:RHS repeat-associated core domain-containing protein [Chitinophaga rhizophila]|uniref:DUF6443 domain-containing protein n=1 Tax=Chitinophaga rhizophila TaxID=2866212 RepID=A0ABS7G4Z0_9BACT|nr:RHS repeat-associated core domain-containing protein [Chitinophaga rhizophila]MBW8682702.1 hypothetical protein [Chitinophaga rhizophila]
MRVVYAKILICLLCVAGFSATAGRVMAYNAVETYQHQIQGRLKKGDTLLLKDEKFDNTDFEWSKLHHRTVSNILTFGLFRDSGIVIPKAFKCEIDLKVEYWSQPGQAEPETKDHIKLWINYDPKAGVSYKDADVYRFMNGHRVKVTINDITSAELGSDYPAIFRLESQVIIERSYELDPGKRLVPEVFRQQIGRDGNSGISGVDTSKYDITLAWEKITGAEEYDLEWTFIDEESDNGGILDSQPANVSADVLKKMFRNNATRVTVPHEYYSISLVHNSRYLIVRIRPVQYQQNGYRQEFPWEYQIKEAGVIKSAVIELANSPWHESGKNWQYSAVYAEDGKKKEVVNYFDGSLRNRQTVTVNNSDNHAVVQESIYDEFGRPLASIMPVPLKGSVFKYYPGLHLVQKDSSYGFRHVYGNTAVCIGTPLALSNDTGAARYYSSRNEFLNDPQRPENKFIADAEGYPLSVTRYTGDNTNRVSVQGGVGPMFQPGAKGATRYFYGKPVQLELDRLFGNDVGYYTHYLKNVTIDGNGQISIAYVNASGKTIATALAGDNPDNMDALPSKQDTVHQTVTLMEREFTFDPSKLQIAATTTHVSTVEGPVMLRFDISRLVRVYSEKNVNICSNCYYEGRIYITDNCGNEIYNSKEPIKVGAILDSCMENAGIVSTTVNTKFTVGEYYIRFELGIPEDAISFYTKAYIRRNTNLKSEWSFINKSLLEKDFFACFNDCVTCKESLGERATFKQMVIARLTADSVAVSRYASVINPWIDSLYTALYNQCAALKLSCNTTPCDDLEDKMKMDVSPGGQYALFTAAGDVLEADMNVLYRNWRTVFQPLPSNSENYIKLQFELEDGHITSPYDSTFTLPLLVRYWNDEWAERFVKYHPEYCALQFCQDNATSYNWDNNLRDMATTVADIPIISGGATFKRDVVDWLAVKDPLFNGRENYRQLFINDLRNYSKNIAGINISGAAVKSLSEFVDYMLYCADFTGNTNINNIPSQQADNWNTCQPAAACRIVDREWGLYFEKYLELKGRYYQRLRDSSNYCGGFCAVGRPFSYDTAVCPEISHFVIEGMPSSCDGVRQNIKVRYLGGKLQRNITLNLYYPVEYDTAANTPKTLTIAAGQSEGQLCINSSVDVSSLRVLSTSCRNMAVGGGSDNQNSFDCSKVSVEISSVLNNGSARTFTLRYLGPQIPEGMSVIAFNDLGPVIRVFFTSSVSSFNLASPLTIEQIRTLQFEIQCNNGQPINTCPVGYQTKTSRIGAINYATPAITTDTVALKAMGEKALLDMISSNCEALADNWIKQLSGCPQVATDVTIQRRLKSKLMELCKLGGDIEHPNGASTLPGNKATVEGYRSFSDVIFGITGATPDMLCNSYLIDAPYPYDVKPQVVEQILTSTNPALCEQLGSLNAEYNAANTSDSFHIYLKKKYGKAMNISSAELALLQAGCTNCRYLLKEPVPMPVFLEKGAKGCITPAEFKQAMTALQSYFGNSLDSTHDNYEMVVANFYNSRFGFTLPFSSYKTYADTIAANTALTMLLCNRPVFANVTRDKYACLMVVIGDAVRTGRSLYRDYIDEEMRLFRKDYLAVCGSNKPTVLLKEPWQTYHYTLYYYDQSGNLIRTIPPEGVHPLDDTLAKQIAAAREVRDADCSEAIKPGNHTKESVLVSLTQAFDQSIDEAMEMWIYNAASGGSQVLATTGGKKYLFNICIDNGYLNFDIYRTNALSGGDADIVLSGHTTVSLSGVGQLSKWTHIVIQGTGLTTNNRTIYVNGTRCAAVTTPPTGACGWELRASSTGAVFPENLASLRHLRLYNHLLPEEIIAANAGVSCLSPSMSYTPAGRDSLVLWATFNIPTGSNGTAEARFAPIYPAHTLATSYAYHSLNGIQAQRTPDGGVSHFWNDMLGRMVVSQNEEQKIPTRGGVPGRQSYTIYDAQGRIVEVGEKLAGATYPDSVAFVSRESLTELYSNNGHQVTSTYYDVPVNQLNTDVAASQQNLRKRVAATAYREGTSGAPQQVTYYSYDQLGNVNTLWQQIQGLGVKKIDYQYDLVSGKVNKVGYQLGKNDRFLYGYEYDAENRLTKAVSGISALSADNWYIENAHTDAAYRYFLHGPLARTELGNTSLAQGVDYAYTLQGWLKGVNGNYLQPDKDMGTDGVKGTNRAYVARDAYAYALDYFEGDYKPIGAANPFPLSWIADSSAQAGVDLYNGNISRSTLALKNINDNKSVGYSYRYDQLNRLKAMLQHQLAPQATKWSALSAGTAYKEDITYDGNGNILSYLRNGGASRGETMDKLAYVYARDASGNLLHNRLLQVTDSVDNTAYTEDLKTQGPNNYLYDNIGNLVVDKQAGIDSVTWTVYGKIARIRKADGSLLQYGYDAAGNRVYKFFTSRDTIHRTWYVRDAQGNTLAVYGNKDGQSDIFWKEQQLYGSSRLGIWKPEMDVTQDSSYVRWTRWGLKEYELTNHLGNVLATISDKPLDSVSGGVWSHYEPEVLTAQDYYPFGMLQPDRKWSLGGYRYGFNGKENDNEVKGEANQQDYGMRVYDPRIGKFLSVDPLTKGYPWYTPYQFAGNTPIQAIDLDGEEELHYTLTKKDDGSASLKLTNITFLPNKNWFYKAFGVFNTRDEEPRIPERAVINYGDKKYYIGFSGSKGRGNEGAMEFFKSIRRNPNEVLYAVDNIFLDEGQSKSVEGFSMAVNTQNNTAMYGSLTDKAWYSRVMEDVRVFRVQGGQGDNQSQPRVLFGRDGKISIRGNEMLFVTLDDKAHQIYFYQKRGGAEAGVEIVSFEIPRSLANEIVNNAVPQRKGREFPNSPQISDPSKSRSAYGLPKAYIDKIRQRAIPGTGRREQPH